MTTSIINNSRDLVNTIRKLESETSGIALATTRLKSAKASISQPTDNQLLTWDEDLSMLVDSEFVFNDSFLRADTARYRRYYHLALNAFNPGASGATWTSATGDHLAGWQLNAVGETIEFSTDVHSDWDGASDLTVEIKFQLLDAGAIGNTVDLRLVMYYMGNGEVATKTQTVEVVTVTDGTQYRMYTVVFTIDYDAAGNVIDAGDVISFELNLETDTSEIDNVIIVGASYYYNTTHIGIESGDS